MLAGYLADQKGKRSLFLPGMVMLKGFEERKEYKVLPGSAQGAAPWLQC